MERQIESLEAEVRHKEESITELSERCGRLGRENSAFKEQNSHLEMSIALRKSITAGERPPSDLVETRMLELERQFYLLKARYARTLKLILSKLPDLEQAFDDGTATCQHIAQLETAIFTLRTELCAVKIRHFVQQHAIEELSRAMDEIHLRDKIIVDLGGTPPPSALYPLER